MNASLKAELNESHKVVSLIRSRAMSSRLFSMLCTEMRSAHGKLLLHTELRSLAWGNVWTSFKNSNVSYWYFIKLKIFLCRRIVALLISFFGRPILYLNELNKSFHRFYLMPSTVYNKTKTLRKMLSIAINDLEVRILLLFLILESLMAENKIERTPPELAKDINNHCESWITDFYGFLSVKLTSELWISNPFLISEIPCH